MNRRPVRRGANSANARATNRRSLTSKSRQRSRPPAISAPKGAGKETEGQKERRDDRLVQTNRKDSDDRREVEAASIGP